MEAKDTVMSQILLDATDGLASQSRIKEIRGLLKAQAEISFKAGYIEGFDGAEATMIPRATEDGRLAGIKEVVEPSKELLEIGRKAIEDTLIEWRDGRLSEFTRGNGLVVREKDGKDSSIIRFGPETALKIGMKAMGQAKLKEWGG